ncbi:hypothetical protein J6590_076739 [Homalodisca vitripennis]|nr:hypothetical protein J6590_076739 [Homalodisca vitripennis]
MSWDLVIFGVRKSITDRRSGQSMSPLIILCSSTRSAISLLLSRRGSPREIRRQSTDVSYVVPWVEVAIQNNTQVLVFVDSTKWEARESVVKGGNGDGLE